MRPALWHRHVRGRNEAEGDAHHGQHRRDHGETREGEPEVARAARRIVFHAGEGTEADPQHQAEQDGDAVGHAVQEALRGARNETRPGGEFDGEPEDQDAEEVEDARARARTAGPCTKAHSTGAAV